MHYIYSHLPATNTPLAWKIADSSCLKQVKSVAAAANHIYTLVEKNLSIPQEERMQLITAGLYAAVPLAFVFPLKSLNSLGLSLLVNALEVALIVEMFFFAPRHIKECVHRGSYAHILELLLPLIVCLLPDSQTALKVSLAALYTLRNACRFVKKEVPFSWTLAKKQRALAALLFLLTSSTRLAGNVAWNLFHAPDIPAKPLSPELFSERYAWMAPQFNEWKEHNEPSCEITLPILNDHSFVVLDCPQHNITRLFGFFPTLYMGLYTNGLGTVLEEPAWKLKNISSAEIPKVLALTTHQKAMDMLSYVRYLSKECEAGGPDCYYSFFGKNCLDFVQKIYESLNLPGHHMDHMYPASTNSQIALYGRIRSWMKRFGLGLEPDNYFIHLLRVINTIAGARLRQCLKTHL